MTGNRLVAAGLLMLAALFATACATSTNLLSPADIAGMRIERIDITFKDDAMVIWGKPQHEFVERELAKKAGKSGVPKRPPSVTDASQTMTDAISAEYNKIADSPEARAHVRTVIAQFVRQRLEKEVSAEFKGSRPVVLEITVHAFVIPSAAQRVVLGGTPNVAAMRVLKDAKTGAELAKLDQLSAAGAGNGVLGVLVDQALPDLEERLIAVFVQQTRDWLLKR